MYLSICYSVSPSIEKGAGGSKSVKVNRLTCWRINVKGEPPPEFTWFKDGQPIKTDEKYLVKNHLIVLTFFIFMYKIDKKKSLIRMTPVQCKHCLLGEIICTRQIQYTGYALSPKMIFWIIVNRITLKSLFEYNGHFHCLGWTYRVSRRSYSGSAATQNSGILILFIVKPKHNK